MFKLWKYRNLIKKIAINDLKLRYKNSILGFFWSLLEPLLMLIVLYVIFSYLMKFDVEYYQLYLLLGIISWELLDKGTGFAITSICGKPNLVKKVYFPREILIISACITALLMVLLELVVFVMFMVIYRVVPGIYIIAFPLILFAEFILVLGLSLGLASLNVYYRDVQHIWAVILRAGFFAAPIIFPLSIIPENRVWIFMLNPMTRIIITMRDSLIYHAFPSFANLAFILTSSLIALVSGYLIFIKLEPKFAEEI